MLEIAGGILIAAAVIAFVMALFRNPGGVWEALKIVGALGCILFVLAIIAAHMRG